MKFALLFACALAAAPAVEDMAAFKMSPKDKTYGDTKVKMDDTEKFSAPKKAPEGSSESVPSIAAAEAGKDGGAPRIIDDYDPNRLGVSADRASGDSDKADAQAVEENVPSSKNTPNEVPADAKDAKVELTTGKGSQSGGVGTKDSTGNSHAEAERLVSDESVSDPTEHNEVVQLQEPSSSDPSKLELDDLGRFMAAVGMIVFSELGDKTFFIAALFAMRHQAMFVFSASFGALALMTVISAYLGRILPSILSPRVTMLLAALLFFFYGAKLVTEALQLESGAGAVEEEMHEVEHEIEEHSHDVEKGNAHVEKKSALQGITNLVSLLISPLWIQIFVMTFLGEWGDRSQIATIAMGTGSHYWIVVLGGLLGHAACTIVAVLGGKLMATRLSLKNITLGGAGCFIVFGFIYLHDWYYFDD